jgi:DNA-binding MarR family transcriptional regulator
MRFVTSPWNIDSYLSSCRRWPALAEPWNTISAEERHVTDTRTFGRVLGETASGARKLHLKLLAEAGTDFDSWVVFTLLAENQPAMPQDVLVADLAERLETDRRAVEGLVDRLVAAGHISVRDGGRTPLVEVTDSGEEFIREVRSTVNQVTQQLIGDLDPENVGTTLAVLRTVGDRAAALL